MTILLVLWHQYIPLCFLIVVQIGIWIFLRVRGDLMVREPWWYINAVIWSRVKFGSAGTKSLCSWPNNEQKIPALEYWFNQRYIYLAPPAPNEINKSMEFNKALRNLKKQLKKPRTRKQLHGQPSSEIPHQHPKHNA